MKISVKPILMTIAFFCLVLFSYTTGLTQTLYIGSGKGAYLTFAVAILIFYGTRSDGYNLHIVSRTECLFIIAFFAVAINNNANIKHGAFDQVLYIFTFFITFILLNRRNDWMNSFFSVTRVALWFFLVMTLYQLINPPFFENTVMPLFQNYSSINRQITDYRLGYRNGFTANAGINAMILVIGVGFYFSKWMAPNDCNNWRGQRKTALFLILFLIGVSITGKRAHAIFSIIAMLITYLVCNSESISKKYLRLIGLAIAVVVVFVVLSDQVPQISSVFDRIMNSQGASDISTGRVALWLQTWTAFIKNPLFGMGWDSMKYYMGINSHNVYLQLLAEMGLVGFVPFVAIFIIGFTHLFKAVKTAITYEYLDFCLVFAFFYQVFFLLYCFTGNPLYDANSLVNYIVSFAIGEYYYQNKETTYGAKIVKQAE